MTNKTKIILRVILGVLGVIAIGYAALSLFAMQSFSSPYLSVVTSPESPSNEVWLLTEGFVDRGVSLFVKSPSINGGKPKRITALDWDGLYSFKNLRWSGDGRLAILSVRLAGDDWPEVAAFGFDFSTGTAIVPTWQGRYTTSPKSLNEWRRHEESLMDVVQNHGGIAKSGIDRETLKSKSRKIWVWQIPKG